MRIAVVTDIHGNLTALEAVHADLRDAAPDLVFHGGDIADSGSSPVAVLDRIRDLGWRGVRGNTDEMLAMPGALDEFAAAAPGIRPLLPVIREMADFTREALGEDRLAWLRALPLALNEVPGLALVHASPASAWVSPQAGAEDGRLRDAFDSLERPVVIYGHIHRPFVRVLDDTMLVANCGSVGLPYDGDSRAAYLLITDGEPEIRRVVYDKDRELQALDSSRMPHARWTAAMLRHAAFVMP